MKRLGCLPDRRKPQNARPLALRREEVYLRHYSNGASVLKHAGSHNLTIDGERFRYVVSEPASDSNGRVALSLVVQHAEKNGSRLRITGLFGERVPEQESKFYKG